MKKSVRKYLMLAVVAVMLLATVFAVSAADEVKYKCDSETCKNALVSPAVGDMVDPTCNSDGYVDYVCPNCRQYLFTVVQENSKLNHILEWEYEQNGDHYINVADCIRDSRCDYTETEQVEVNDKHQPVKYHKVIFRNAFTTATKLESCKYATIAMTYADTIIAEQFVKENELVSQNGALRNADEDFGKYKFLGWASAEKIGPYLDAYTAFDARKANLYETTATGIVYTNQALRDFIYGVNGENYVYMKTSGVADSTSFKVPVEGEDVKADYTVYAIFDVAAIDAYNVVFYDDIGRVIDETHYNTEMYNKSVDHGDNLSENNDKKPEKADDDFYTYTFSHWVLKGTETRINLDDPVYASINLQARFTRVPRQYTIKYFYRDGEPIELNGNPVFDVVTVAPDEDYEKKEPVNGLHLNRISSVTDKDVYDKLFEYSDLVYDYSFTGKWEVAGLGREFDLNDMNFEGILDTMQTGGYIKLLPQYRKITRLYPLVVNVQYVQDHSTSHPDEVTLTIKNEEGFVRAETIDFNNKENVFVNEIGVEYYRQEFYVPYSTSYTVTASADAYAGSATTTFKAGYGILGITLERVGRDNCTCMCHSFLKPIWIKVLNLLNTLFKLKVVCCDDMYANIGGDLNYTA